MARSLRGEVCLPARSSLRRVARASGNRPIPLGGNYGSQKASRAGAVAVGWARGFNRTRRVHRAGPRTTRAGPVVGDGRGPKGSSTCGSLVRTILRRGSTPGTRGRSPAEWRWVPLCRARDDELERYRAALRRRACTEPPGSLALLRHAKPSVRTNDCKCPARGAQRRASGEREYARMASDCLPGG